MRYRIVKNGFDKFRVEKEETFVGGSKDWVHCGNGFTTFASQEEALTYLTEKKELDNKALVPDEVVYEDPEESWTLPEFREYCKSRDHKYDAKDLKDSEDFLENWRKLHPEEKPWWKKLFG